MIDMSKTFSYGRKATGGQKAQSPQMTAPGTNTGPLPDQNATPPAIQGQNWSYDPYQNFTMQPPGAFPFPQQWADASNYFTNLLGAGVQTPWQYGYGSDQLRNMIDAQGMPVNIQGYAEAQLPQLQTMLSDATKQAQESAGLTGTRWSTSLGNTIADQARRLYENYGADVAGKWLQAQEAARERMMGGMGMMLPYGQATANLGLQNTQNQMYAANALQGLGSDYLYGPMNIAQGMAGLGQGIYGQQAQGIEQFMNDPWLQAALGMSGQQGNYYPQTYQPSFMSQMFGLSGAMLPWTMNYNRGGGGQGIDYGTFDPAFMPHLGPM